VFCGEGVLAYLNSPVFGLIQPHYFRKEIILDHDYETRQLRGGTDVTEVIKQQTRKLEEPTYASFDINGDW
jgi:hypothetical protein